MRRLIVVIGLLALLPTTTAWGDAAPDLQMARKHFQSGTKHFDLGEYDAALADFKEAYRIKDDPVLLYNIAQCHRMLHHNEEALRAYRTFLSRATDSAHRADVEQKVAALEEAIDKQNRASNLPPSSVLQNRSGDTPAEETPGATTRTTAAPAEAAPANAVVATAPERKPVYKKWWFWTAIGGVVVVGAAVGIGLGVGLSSHSSTNTFPSVAY
jgi:tetratricopeptide (TPR) repeat protein